MACFQECVSSTLLKKVKRAAEERGYKQVVLAGGVAANSALRKAAEEAALKAGIEFYRPSPILCTDNGAMIACAAHYASKERRASSNLNAFANVSIENIDGLFNKSAN